MHVVSTQTGFISTGRQRVPAFVWLASELSGRCEHNTAADRVQHDSRPLQTSRRLRRSSVGWVFIPALIRDRRPTGRTEGRSRLRPYTRCLPPVVSRRALCVHPATAAYAAGVTTV